MPLTAKDFKIYNSTPEYVRQLDQAFDYFRAKYPDGADAALQYLHDNNKAFMNNGPSNPYVGKLDAGTDAFGHFDGRDVILWNPATGILVTSGGKVTGIESAADGLAHEIWGHAFNPANDIMDNILDSQYGRANERIAVGVESSLNVLFGEPLRDNHGGVEVWTSDVTVRTIMTEDGALQLVRTNALGQDEYGPQIGTTGAGWEKLQHAFDQMDNAITAGQAVSGAVDGIVFITGRQYGETAGGYNDGYNGGGDPEPTNGGHHDHSAEAIHNGEGWLEWNGEIDEGGGKNPSDTLQDKSSDDPDYQYASHMMAQIGKLADAPADLSGGADWLLHFGEGQREHDGGIGHPQPEPGPVAGGDVPVVGVHHVEAGVLM